MEKLNIGIETSLKIQNVIKQYVIQSFLFAKICNCGKVEVKRSTYLIATKSILVKNLKYQTIKLVHQGSSDTSDCIILFVEEGAT